MDMYVSYFAMPIGVAICFGPAVLVWWLTRDRSAEERADSSRK